MNAASLQPTQSANGWQARLELGCSARLGASRLTHRRHFGPLAIQKPLYPEGPDVCHALLLHPPAGIAGGDRLEIDIAVEEQAALLITTPGATKWYRSNARLAQQSAALRVASRASLEWLPQEAIVFDGALGAAQTSVSLASDAHFIGWDIVCLGRTASGERFTRGALKNRLEISVGERRVWGDYAHFEGGGALLDSAAGLAGFPVVGTFITAGRDIDRAIVDQCRTIAPPAGARVGVTTLPKIFAARYLGHSAESARSYFVALWRIMRPVLLGREAIAPRIWAT